MHLIIEERQKSAHHQKFHQPCRVLIKHGIDPERLTAVGYGEEQPVIVDEQLHQQYPYLPKDQVLDEAFITTLPSDKQELCNSLNRRTEFRVLKTTYNLY